MGYQHTPNRVHHDFFSQSLTVKAESSDLRMLQLMCKLHAPCVNVTFCDSLGILIFVSDAQHFLP